MSWFDRNIIGLQMRFPLPFASIGMMLLLLGGCASSQDRADTRRDLRVADIELASGAPEAALQVVQDLAIRRPRDAAVLIRLGQANAALGRRQAAETSFRRALACQPGNFDAAFGLARLHLGNDAARALKELQVLAARQPRDARVLTDLGVAYDLEARPHDAQSSYRKAIEVDPSLISTQVDLGLSLALSGHPAEALLILGPLAQVADAAPRVREDYAVAATLAGRTGDALAILGHDLPREQVLAAVTAYQALRSAPD